MIIPALHVALALALALSADPGKMSSGDHTEAELLAYRPPARDEFARRFTLEARLGIGTPTGGVGVAGEFSFIPELGLGCGVGSNVDGLESGCWLRVRPVRNRHRAFTFSSGMSSAPFTQNVLTAGGVFGFFTSAMAQAHDGPAADRVWKQAYWLNTDAGYESRRGPFLFRAFGGVAVLLNPSDGAVQASDSADAKAPDAPLSALLYAGVGVGFAE